MSKTTADTRAKRGVARGKSICRDMRLKKLDKEVSESEVVFEIQKGVVAGYKNALQEKVKEYQNELIDRLIEGALEGDLRVNLELVKTYLPNKVVFGIEHFKAETLRECNLAASRILEAKTKGRIEKDLADDLLSNINDRVNAIMGSEIEEKLEKIITKG
jgi:hypothetical protein